MAFSRSRPNCLIPTMFYVSRALYDFRNWTRRISSLLNRLVVTKISVTELVFKKVTYYLKERIIFVVHNIVWFYKTQVDYSNVNTVTMRTILSIEATQHSSSYLLL